ncbi:MAG: hypothetical protein GX096_04770 [Clostridiales bacterium]|nr:hypothetical protein [Clostridiales bacterium]
MYLTQQDVQQILQIIDSHFKNATVFLEIMSPMVAGKVQEKSIKASNAKFTWGVKSGKELEPLAPSFTFQADHSRMETMPDIYPVYKVIGKVSFTRNLSNKITVLSNTAHHSAQ